MMLPRSASAVSLLPIQSLDNVGGVGVPFGRVLLPQRATPPHWPETAYAVRTSRAYQCAQKSRRAIGAIG